MPQQKYLPERVDLDKEFIKQFKIRIVIEGEPGVGKSIIRDVIYNHLKNLMYPTGWTAKDEFALYTSLKD